MTNREMIENDPAPFSWKARIKSFTYAWAGIIQFFRKEHNARIHLAATVLVLILSLLLKVSRADIIILVFSVAFVWITEMINTAVEKAMDFISTDRHPKIKLIKDLSAGAVLIAVIAAVTAGSLIFFPKLFP